MIPPVVENSRAIPPSPLFLRSSLIHKVDILFVIGSCPKAGAPGRSGGSRGTPRQVDPDPPGGPPRGQHYPLRVREREFLCLS